MSSSKITIDELICEMDKVQESVRGAMDGMSTVELAEAWGVAEDTVRERLKLVNRAGRLIAGKRRITDIAGRPAWTPVYKIKKEVYKIKGRGGKKK